MTALADWVVLPLVVLGLVCGFGLMVGGLAMVAKAAVLGLVDRRRQR